MDRFDGGENGAKGDPTEKKNEDLAKKQGEI